MRPMREARWLAIAMMMCACESRPLPASDPSVAITPIALDGTTFEREDGTRVELRGPTVLHFWATWCPPCRRELPALRDAASHLDEGAVLAVSVDASWEEVRTFFQGTVPPFVVRVSSGDPAGVLGVSSLPDTYAIDEEGRAVRRIAGAIDWNDPSHRIWLRDATTRDVP